MAPLTGFSDNTFQSRDDVLTAVTSLLRALTPYKSACGARIKLSTATGTGFDEISAQMEGFSRPLWVVAELLALQSTDSVVSVKTAGLDLNSWVRGLIAGVDPSSDSFWGHLDNHDQRMVEMEPIAFALLSAPSVFLAQDSDFQINEENKKKIIDWLYSINNKDIPPSNWRWFRVLVNLSLVKSCGVPYDKVKQFMDADLKLLDTFYLGDGWSSDGIWSEDKKQVDYYSGSFAIQFSQLVYIRFAYDLDPERVDHYRAKAGKFAQTFWRYFDTNGAAIPFGRSLSYRFAFAAFWSAVAVAEVPLPLPLNDLGTIKGLLLRHLRWWANKIDMFNTDGTFTIGYTYPNMYMSEDYNSPQSLYWCLKTFSILGLPENHPFWSCEELPHPFSIDQRQLNSHGDFQKGVSLLGEATQNLNSVCVIPPALHIICSSQEHHFLLSCGQFTRKSHKAREAKYSKLAYSSAFAFSVPTGPLLEQMAPDSTLCVSNDNEDTWRIRWEPIGARVAEFRLSMASDSKDKAEEISSALVSTWQPWRASDIQIETTLIPLTVKWPGWHVRIHKLIWGKQASNERLSLIDAGFAISSQCFNGGNLPRLKSDLDMEDTAQQTRQCGPESTEGHHEGNFDCLIISGGGASGIAQLRYDHQNALQHSYRGHIIKPDANTNLITQRTLIPTIRHDFTLNNYPNVREEQFISGIFAVAASAGLDVDTIKEMWHNKPNLKFETISEKKVPG